MAYPPASGSWGPQDPKLPHNVISWHSTGTGIVYTVATTSSNTSDALTKVIDWGDGVKHILPGSGEPWDKVKADIAHTLTMKGEVFVTVDPVKALTQLTSAPYTQDMTQTVQVKNPSEPASQAQVSYLNDLVVKRDNDTIAQRYQLLTALGTLTKGQASEWIGELLKSPKKDAKPVEQWTPVGTVSDFKVEPVVEPEPIEAPAFGYYSLEGKTYFWDVTGKDKWPTLRRLTIITNYDGTKKGSWTKVSPSYSWPQAKVTFLPYMGQGYNAVSHVTKTVRLPVMLIGKTPMTATAAGELGKEFGFCVRCGRTLSDPVSIAQGVGPVCITYWS